MSFRIPKSRDLDTFGEELHRRSRSIRRHKKKLHEIKYGFSSTPSFETKVVSTKKRPFSASDGRAKTTHFASESYRQVPGVEPIPNLTPYTTPSMRPRIDPIYPSRYENIEKKGGYRDQYKRSPYARPPTSVYSPNQRIDEQKRHMLAGVKHVKLKYRSSGVDVAVALSEAASGCGTLPPDGHGRMMSNGKRSVPSVKRVLLCIETLDKLCLHPGFTPAEQKQLHVVVDHVKDGLLSSSYFAPPAHSIRLGPTKVDEGQSDQLGDAVFEPAFYFDIAQHLENSNENLLIENETLKKLLEKEREQVKIYRSMLKESQSKVGELRETMEAMDTRNGTMSRRLTFMQDAASDSLQEYNKLNAQYVVLDQQNTLSTNRAAKSEKELSGLYTMYNGVSSELSSALKACGQLETKLKQLEPLEKLLQEKNLEILKLEDTIRDLNTAAKAMNEKLTNNEDQIKSLTRRASMTRRGSFAKMAVGALIKQQ
eukprot:Stramenopile-MAST_4_protein_1206